MNTDQRHQYWEMLRGLLRRDSGVLPRMALTIGSGLLLSAASLVAAWSLAWLRFSSGRSTAGSRGWMYVTDEDLAICFAGGALAWFLLLGFIWRGEYRAKTLLMPVILTMALAVATALAAVSIDGLVRNEEEYLIGAACLAAGCLLLVIWLPVALRWMVRERVVNDENLVQVHCPTCGYSMIGLKELRCPECGTQFTIDELIRRQGYDVAGARRFTHSGGTAASDRPRPAIPGTAESPIAARRRN